MRRLLFLVLIFFQFQVDGQKIEVIQPVRFLALGDSYTIGQNVDETERWPVQLKSTLENIGIEFEELNIIAQTGWRTDNLIDAIEKQNPDSNYNLVSLLIGVKNQFQGADFEIYKTEFEELLKIAIQLAGNNKKSVFVLSIPDYGYTPFGIISKETISEEIDKYNLANKEITKKYDVAYIDITSISREGIEKPEYVAEDGLHPSGEMYYEWINLILASMDLNSTSVFKAKNDESSYEFYVDSENRKLIFISMQAFKKETQYEIFDLSGRMLISGKLFNNEIDISGLRKGMYLLRINGNSVFSQSFLLNR